MTLCGGHGEAGASIRHNVKPGTPMGRGLLAFPGGFLALLLPLIPDAEAVATVSMIAARLGQRYPH